MRLKLLTSLLLLIAAAFSITAQEMTTTFTVTIENVSGSAMYANTGVASTPTGMDAAGPATPGNAYEFTVSAVPGDSLTFATMLAQSNDLFFAPEGAGIALFDENDAPISGDVTDQVLLWDAGTEVNEPIGEGANQAPRQAAPNTGEDENGVVQLVSDLNDGLAYPAAADIILVTVTANDDETFTIRVENVSDESDFPTPITPVVWLVSGGDMMMDDGDMMADAPLFAVGQPDYGYGLEALAEDGNPQFLATVLGGSPVATPITPVVWVLHDNMMMDGVFFNAGAADRGDGLEALAEDGNASALGEFVQNMSYAAAGVAATPVDADAAGPATPGNRYEFSFEAVPGQNLSFVTMFAQSNDLFFAPDAAGITLFDEDGNPISGTVTRYVSLWDAGTEVNEPLGEGANQAPRQSAPNTGDDENGVVTSLAGNPAYSPAPSIIRVTITTSGM